MIPVPPSRAGNKENLMAKGQLRSNKEKKTPKQDKKPSVPPSPWKKPEPK